MPVAKARLERERFISTTRLGVALTEEHGAQIARAKERVSVRYQAGAEPARAETRPEIIGQICDALREHVDPDGKALRGFDVRVFAQGVCADAGIEPCDPAAVHSRHVVLVPAPYAPEDADAAAAAAVRAVAAAACSDAPPNEKRSACTSAARSACKEVITFSSKAPGGAVASTEVLLTPAAALSLTTLGAAAMKLSFDAYREADLPARGGFRPQRIRKNPRARVILVIDAINSPDGFERTYQRVERLMMKAGMTQESLAARALDFQGAGDG